MRKSKAFTLAEVLITLVIIGVIAAMTIPTLMGSTNEQEMKSKLKKGFSALNQAFAMEYALYGHNIMSNGEVIITKGQAEQMIRNHLSIVDSDIVNEDGWDRVRLVSADGFKYELYGDNDEMSGINLRVDSDSKERVISWWCSFDLEEAAACKPNTFSLSFAACGKETSHQICPNDGITYSYLYDVSLEEAFETWGNVL